MLLSREIKKMFRRTGMRLFKMLNKDAGARFDPNAYYLSMGGALVSTKPYYGWHNAYRAAKRFHRSAFFMSGATINHRITQSQYSGAKKAWSMM